MSYIREEILPTADSYPYVTGNGFRNRSHLIYDEFRKDGPENITEDGQVVFIKIDLVESFFWHVMSNVKYRVKIITHNGAKGLDLSYLQYLNNKKVINWFAQNANIRHEKLTSIPLGLANKRWAHGNTEIIEDIASSQIERRYLAYMNFDIGTNSDKRSEVHKMFFDKDYVYCAPKKPFVDYLKDLKLNKFCISPQGRGADCHRIWESILMGTIPIVKNCQNISFYRDMPILIINNWEQINQQFLEEQYENKLNTWNDSKLFLDYWVEKIGLKNE